MYLTDLFEVGDAHVCLLQHTGNELHGARRRSFHAAEVRVLGFGQHAFNGLCVSVVGGGAGMAAGLCGDHTLTWGAA